MHELRHRVHFQFVINNLWEFINHDNVGIFNTIKIDKYLQI